MSSRENPMPDWLDFYCARCIYSLKLQRSLPSREEVSRKGQRMTTRTLFIVRCAVVLLAVIWAGSVCQAQVLYGSLTGNVSDPTGAAVPGVHVEAVNLDRKSTRLNSSHLGISY